MEENQKKAFHKKRFLKDGVLFGVSLIQIACGGLFLFHGALKIASKALFYYAGFEIWMGLMILAAGILTFLTARFCYTEDKSDIPLWVCLILALIGIVGTFTGFVLTAYGLAHDSAATISYDTYYLDNADIATAAHILQLAACISGFAACLVQTIFIVRYFYYHKNRILPHFKGRKGDGDSSSSGAASSSDLIFVTNKTRGTNGNTRSDDVGGTEDQRWYNRMKQRAPMCFCCGNMNGNQGENADGGSSGIGCCRRRSDDDNNQNQDNNGGSACSCFNGGAGGSNSGDTTAAACCLTGLFSSMCHKQEESQEDIPMDGARVTISKPKNPPRDNVGGAGDGLKDMNGGWKEQNGGDKSDKNKKNADTKDQGPDINKDNNKNAPTNGKTVLVITPADKDEKNKSYMYDSGFIHDAVYDSPPQKPKTQMSVIGGYHSPDESCDMEDCEICLNRKNMKRSSSLNNLTLGGPNRPKSGYKMIWKTAANDVVVKPKTRLGIPISDESTASKKWTKLLSPTVGMWK